MTNEINICSVKTDVWHNRRISFEASSRHSDGYFLEVKPEAKTNQHTIGSVHLGHTHHHRDTADKAETFQEAQILSNKLGL